MHWHRNNVLMNTDIYRVCKKGCGRTLTTRSAHQTKQKDILCVIISCRDFYSSLSFCVQNFCITSEKSVGKNLFPHPLKNRNKRGFENHLPSQLRVKVLVRCIGVQRIG